jgi:predicted dehydrogenase
MPRNVGTPRLQDWAWSEDELVGLRFAVIGCGAIAEAYFLPVLVKRPDLCSVLWAVDPDPGRLAAVSKQPGVRTALSLEEVADDLDAAVVAAPHNAHFALASKLIAAGKHVLCEKPLTTTLAESEALVSAAERAGVVLMTNNWRRHSPAFREIRRLLETGALGRPVAASWTEGWKFAWPTKTGFYFTQRPQDGLPAPGVLLDTGAHVIDVLCWWLGSEPVVVECLTDSFGGPEGRARLVLNFAGARAQADLSYYHKMVNTYAIECEGGRISGAVGEEHLFTLVRDGSKPEMVRLARGRITQRMHAVGMISNFVAAVAGRERPLVSGRDVLPSIRAITQGYQQAQGFDAPWLPRLA